MHDIRHNIAGTERTTARSLDQSRTGLPLLWVLLTLGLLALALAWSGGHALADEGRSTIPAPPSRVTDGLVALYTFQEGGGAIVRDVSGVGDPLDLFVYDGTAVSWAEDHLSVNSPTLIASAFPARKITDEVKRTNEITLEAWIKPESAYRYGPARIVTISSDHNNRNITLGQEKKNWTTVYDVRLRTTTTNNNGTPSTMSPVGTLTTSLTHVVYTRQQDGTATLYINGAPVEVKNIPGRLVNWDDNYRLALADELNGKRSWLGEYHLVAFYGKALSPGEVGQNYRVGLGQDEPGAEPTPEPQPGDRVTEGLQALYTFEEGKGSVIQDVSGVGAPLDLFAFDGTAVRWEGGALHVDRPTLISSAFPAGKIKDAVGKSNELTVEAWITPDEINQQGPARIVTISLNPHQRNFTLGHEKYAKYDARLRTTVTSQNGVPSVSTANGLVTTELTHLVYTRNSSTNLATLYVDGVPKAVRTVEGRLTNWADGYRLALANEQTNNRPWLGAYHLVAIYDRALSPSEVNTNYTAGPRDGETVNLPTQPGPVQGSPEIEGDVVINLGPTNQQGAIHSTSPLLSLAMNATTTQGSITKYRASGDLNNLGAWQTFTQKADLTLSAGNGPRMVYVQYQDSKGNVSSVYSDTIIVDSSAGIDFGVSINNGDIWTSSPTVMLTLPAEPRTAEMQVSNDGGFIGVPWEPYTLYKNWETISYGTELIQPVVYVRFRSVDGQTSPVYQDDIILDIQPPVATMTGAGVDPQARLAHASDDGTVPVRVSWTSSDNLSGVRWHDVQVRIGDGEWLAWLEQYEGFEAIFEGLPGVTYSFRARAEDQAGNWSDYPSDAHALVIAIPEEGSSAPSNTLFLPAVTR